MKLAGKATMLRIYFGEDDKWKSKPLYRAIVEKCRELDIAGATVLRGIAGYGASTLIHRSHLFSFSHDAPKRFLQWAMEIRYLSICRNRPVDAF